MDIQIISQPVKKSAIDHAARDTFGDLVKAVVDVEHGVLAIGGELHADEEAVLLENGSEQSDLWGINLYPFKPDEEWIEFDSLINIRPTQGNRSRNVDNAEIRKKIIQIVERLIEKE